MLACVAHSHEVDKPKGQATSSAPSAPAGKSVGTVETGKDELAKDGASKGQESAAISLLLSYKRAKEALKNGTTGLQSRETGAYFRSLVCPFARGFN